MKLGIIFNYYFKKYLNFIRYKIYELNSEVFNNLTTEEQNNFFNHIKKEYNEATIKWYLTNLGICNKWLQYSIINP